MSWFADEIEVKPALQQNLKRGNLCYGFRGQDENQLENSGLTVTVRHLHWLDVNLVQGGQEL
jgi:hypothetical protein